MDISDLKPAQKLTPFGHFCVTIGHLPSSYMASLTYEEQLLWLCKYIEETIIPAVNNNAEALEEVQALFVQLKNYVDDYFDNLDVQEEINTKLDTMVTDGTLNTIINQEIFGNINQEILALQEEDTLLDQKITTNSSAISNLQEENTLLDQRITTNTSAISNLQETDTLLDQRITANTSAITNLQEVDTTLDQRITTNSSAISNLQDSDTSLDQRITANTSAINSLQTVDTTLDQRITTNSSAISNLQDTDTSLDQRITANTSAINSLQTADTSLDQRITAIDNYINSETPISHTNFVDFTINFEPSAYITSGSLPRASSQDKTVFVEVRNCTIQFINVFNITSRIAVIGTWQSSVYSPSIPNIKIPVCLEIIHGDPATSSYIFAFVHFNPNGNFEIHIPEKQNYYAVSQINILGNSITVPTRYA